MSGQALEQVYQAVAVGVSHPKLGEVPCVMAVLKRGRQISEEEMKEALEKFLARNEIPEKILFVEQLPLLSSGKPDKQRIKTMF